MERQGILHGPGQQRDLFDKFTHKVGHGPQQLQQNLVAAGLGQSGVEQDVLGNKGLDVALTKSLPLFFQVDFQFRDYRWARPS